MTGFSCLYRRPSGIYVVRISVPKHLRTIIGKTEVHSTTGTRNFAEAKVISSQIQAKVRQKFMILDSEKLLTPSVLLTGDGLIHIREAAALIGLSLSALLCEITNTTNLRIYTRIQTDLGWLVDDIYEIEREDEHFLLQDAQEKGYQTSFDGMVRLQRPRTSVDLWQRELDSYEQAFMLEGQSALFCDKELVISVNHCSMSKHDIESIRLRIASQHTLITPAPATPSERLAAPSDPKSGTSHDDSITLHPATLNGNVLFSELYAKYKAVMGHGQDQERRMKTESDLFIGLAGDLKMKELGDPSVITNYFNELLKTPTDIYQARRRINPEPTHKELQIIAANEGLKLKKESTAKGHIGRLCEILNFGVEKGFLHINIAAKFKRGWTVGAAVKEASKERAIFTEETLNKIFSAQWFTDGQVSGNGRKSYRPFYYWLPLLGLFVGGRINELSQLYLDDIYPSIAGGNVWYIDFNINQPDKKDTDEPDYSADKSIKNVNSVRQVPIHSRLIELGLLDYVEALRRAGFRRLFPEVRPDEIKGYGKPPSSWFNGRYLGKQLGIARDGTQVFHSFRHTFNTQLYIAGVQEEVRAQLSGHLRGTTENIRYAKSLQAEKLSPFLERLAFDHLPTIAKFDCEAGLSSVHYAIKLKK